jgi:limonene-1,2-epoxide hydrolase
MPFQACCLSEYPTLEGTGGYLLSAILHNRDDDAARAILRRCAEAADRDGTVFVVEKIGADGETVHTERDLRVRAYGREGCT